MSVKRHQLSKPCPKQFSKTNLSDHRQAHMGAVVLITDQKPLPDLTDGSPFDRANAKMRLVINQRRASTATAADAQTDEALMAAMANGDGAALAVLTARHGPRIAALAYRMLGPSGDCDEVVQETFLRLWKRAALWEPGRAQLSTWLHRVASNLAIDRLRRKTPVSLDEAPDIADHGPRPDAAIEAQQASASIEEALEELAPRQRLAITLCHYQELSNIEAADIMGVSVDALESLLARGRRNLKEALMSQREWLMDTVADGQIAAGQDQAGRGK